MYAANVYVHHELHTSVSPTILISGCVKQAAGTLRWLRTLLVPEICSITVYIYNMNIYINFLQEIMNCG